MYKDPTLVHTDLLAPALAPPPPPPQDNLDLTVQAPFPVTTRPLRLAIGRCTSHWNAFSFLFSQFSHQVTYSLTYLLVKWVHLASPDRVLNFLAVIFALRKFKLYCLLLDRYDLLKYQ